MHGAWGIDWNSGSSAISILRGGHGSDGIWGGNESDLLLGAVGEDCLNSAPGCDLLMLRTDKIVDVYASATINDVEVGRICDSKVA